MPHSSHGLFSSPSVCIFNMQVEPAIQTGESSGKSTYALASLVIGHRTFVVCFCLCLPSTDTIVHHSSASINPTIQQSNNSPPAFIQPSPINQQPSFNHHPASGIHSTFIQHSFNIQSNSIQSNPIQSTRNLCKKRTTNTIEKTRSLIFTYLYKYHR